MSRGVKRALVCCDFPFGPVQEGSGGALKAAIRLVKEAGADIIKLDGAADFPETVRALVRAGIPVLAQFGITPQTALQYGIPYSAHRGGRGGAAGDDVASWSNRPSGWKRPVHRCSISPIPARSRARRWRGRCRFR